MGHIEEKTESYVTDPAGKHGAKQGTRSVSHQLLTFRRLHIWELTKRLAIILMASPWFWSCCELQPNVMQILKIRTGADGLELMQHNVSGKNSTQISAGGGWRKILGYILLMEWSDLMGVGWFLAPFKTIVDSQLPSIFSGYHILMFLWGLTFLFSVLGDRDGTCPWPGHSGHSIVLATVIGWGMGTGHMSAHKESITGRDFYKNFWERVAVSSVAERRGCAPGAAGGHLATTLEETAWT